MRNRMLMGALLIGALAIAVPAFAGNGNGNGRHVSDPACVVSGNVVSAAGLPTGQVINFMVTDASGTTGWVLGLTDTGSLSTTVPAVNGPTTYQFVSRTWGPNGSHYDVFSSCNA